MLKSSLFILFCKTDADFIKKQHLYFTWLYILCIQFRFWTSLIHVEHCSMIPLIRLCYTLSRSRHQNVVTLVQLGCKRNIWFSCFYTFIVRTLCFLNNIMQDVRKWYTLSWPHSAMTWSHDLQHLRPLNYLKLSKKSGSIFKNNLQLSSYLSISTKQFC